MGRQSDVFISYKREERAEARKLAQALSCYNVDAWYDTSSKPEMTSQQD